MLEDAGYFDESYLLSGPGRRHSRSLKIDTAFGNWSKGELNSFGIRFSYSIGNLEELKFELGSFINGEYQDDTDIDLTTW